MQKIEKVYYDSGIIASITYFLNEKRHRENAPASIWYFPNGNLSHESFMINGLFHREDGPAIIYYNNADNSIYEEAYYLNGVRYRDKDIIDNWEAFCKMQIFL